MRGSPDGTVEPSPPLWIRVWRLPRQLHALGRGTRAITFTLFGVARRWQGVMMMPFICSFRNKKYAQCAG